MDWVSREANVTSWKSLNITALEMVISVLSKKAVIGIGHFLDFISLLAPWAD